MALRDLIARLLRDARGNALAIFAGALVPLIAIIGSGLDLGTRYMAEAKLQNACDAGVLAGRQAMQGNLWNAPAMKEADKYFEFNFPKGTHQAEDLKFQVKQNTADPSELLGEASAKIPTSLMKVLGFNELEVSVQCDAKRDMGNNDVMLVLDVTGSMAQAPSNGGGTKIARLRTAASGLYRALKDSNGSVTRFGIVPYSHTVNVARVLGRDDILRDQRYVGWLYRQCDYYYGSWHCGDHSSVTKPNEGYSNNNSRWIGNVRARTVLARNSSWAKDNSDTASIDNFRLSGNGCVEERPSTGQQTTPVRIESVVYRADVDRGSSGSTDAINQFGRYDPDVQNALISDPNYRFQVGCPSEAKKLATYDTETAFNSAINAATARVTGGTYHDVGMLWGLRFISRTGFFRNDNPQQVKGFPVNQHIVFMTDGILDTGPYLYSTHGVEYFQTRTLGDGSQNQRHLARFRSACNLAKSMGITVWVIALDVTNTSDVSPCATSADHFYTSNGSDLEEVFSTIGRGIGNLRLSR